MPRVFCDLSKKVLSHMLVDETTQTDPVTESKSGMESKILEMIHNISKGKLSAEIKGSGVVFEELRNLLNQMHSNAQSDLKDTVMLSSMASDSMAAVSFVSGDIKDIHSHSQTIASAAEELSVTSREISQSMTDVNENIIDVKKSTQLGQASLTDCISKMKNVTNSVQSTTDTVESLASASSEIGQILDVITSISSQTHLLSLNARIEAERAGEFGRGFAVVADEVKELAKHSANASDDIGKIVSSIQKEVKKMQTDFGEVLSYVGQSQEQVHVVESEINSIVNHVDNVSAKISDNARRIDNQNEATVGVTKSIIEIKEKSERSENNTAKAINAVSSIEGVLSKKFKAFEGMEIKDAIVELAKSDHFLWKKRLAEMFVGKNKLAESELSDHHQCRLGKWYDSVTEPRFIQSNAYKSLYEPHMNVHKAAIESVKLFNMGDYDGALKEFERMELGSQDVVACLNLLEMKEE